MTSRNTLMIATVLAAVVVGGAGTGCGNYSNEDLEYMNALPEREDLQAEIPVRSALAIRDRAELYQLTHGVSGVFNVFVDQLLSLIDAVRSYSPTTRRPNERIWGPFPADQQPGWFAQMVMTRDADLATFHYRVEFKRPSDAAWFPLITGWFSSSGGVRKGTGQLSLVTAALRAQGFYLDPDKDPNCVDVDPNKEQDCLDSLLVDYQTATFPVRVDLQITNLDDATKPDDVLSATYNYGAQSNGDGALSFDLVGAFIDGVSPLEKANVTSRWLGTGEGRADQMIVEGDSIGATYTQCWNSQFGAVYSHKSWTTDGELGAETDCTVIPFP